MGKLLLDNISGIAGEAIKILVLIVVGVVILDRVKNLTSANGSNGLSRRSTGWKERIDALTEKIHA